MDEYYGYLKSLQGLAAEEQAALGLTAGLMSVWAGGPAHCPPGLGRVQGH